MISTWFSTWSVCTSSTKNCVAGESVIDHIRSNACQWLKRDVWFQDLREKLTGRMYR